MPKPSEETVLTILVILDAMGKATSPETVVSKWEIYEKVLLQRPLNQMWSR